MQYILPQWLFECDFRIAGAMLKQYFDRSGLSRKGKRIHDVSASDVSRFVIHSTDQGCRFLQQSKQINLHFGTLVRKACLVTSMEHELELGSI